MEPYYDPELVRSMWEELADIGVEPVTTAAEVDSFLSQPNGTVLVVVNSVCGCAAGSARPGVALALQHRVVPDRRFTVFAGMDHEAVKRVRAFMPHVAPSSPAIALFKDGKPVYILERRLIEQMDDQMVADCLMEAFDRYCSSEESLSPRRGSARPIRHGAALPSLGA
jgi:putative YphP/YqiW family bacilliredoxin